MPSSVRRNASWIAGIVATALLAGSCGAELSEPEAEELEVSESSAALDTYLYSVKEATYGGNCRAPRGNATNSVIQRCSGGTKCSYPISVNTLGDPAYRCAKDFYVRWSCADKALLAQHINGEANGQAARISCESVPASYGKITVLGATYGGNCYTPANAAPDVGATCDGYGYCKYFISTFFLGDPAYRCAKDFVVHYECSNHYGKVRVLTVSGEAHGKTVNLTCPK